MNVELLVNTTALAQQLMREHGLTQDGWTFKFSNKKTALGTCYYDRKLIEVSKWYVDSHPDEIRDTILHEIAHALVGPNHGHDHVWRMKCIEVGANPTRTSDAAKTTFNGNYNYLIECESCGKRWRRHRLKQAILSARCPDCHTSLTILDLKNGDVFETSPYED